MALHSFGTVAAIAALIALAVAGITLTIYGLRHDLRERKRSYRRRGPRPPDRTAPPTRPAKD
jgi:hypothetical protein